MKIKKICAEGCYKPSNRLVATSVPTWIEVQQLPPVPGFELGPAREVSLNFCLIMQVTNFCRSALAGFLLNKQKVVKVWSGDMMYGCGIIDVLVLAMQLDCERMRVVVKG